MYRAVLAWIPILLSLAACQPHNRSGDGQQGRQTPHGYGPVVLDISPARYRPANGARVSETEIAACRAWSLDARQAETFFALSGELQEGALHDYSWLPCSISGRLRSDGREWEFEINAAGTSTWRSGNEARLLGCNTAACEPFVVLMPDSTR